MISHYSIKLRQVSLISLLALLLISVIGTAIADTTPTKPSNTPYQLSDLEKASAAPLQIMAPAVSAVMTDTVLLSDPLAVASVPAISSEFGSTADETSEPQLLSKTTLSPGVIIDGLACNILHTPIGKHRWSILQYDLSLDTDNQTAVFVSDEDTTIQSVSCSADGSQVLMAIQDGVGGDSEIYLIDQANNEILRLTDNDTEDLDVSMSQDGRVIVWQGHLADDREAVFVRTIAEDGSYSDIALGSKFPMTQPSLSANGDWLLIVNERNSLDHLVRYQVATGEYTIVEVINNRRYEVIAPSISNDGTKVLWVKTDVGQALMLTDLLIHTSEVLLQGNYAEGYGLGHPMLSGDGKAMIYSINSSTKRQTFLRVLRSGSVFRLGKVLWPENRYLGNQLSAVVDIVTYEVAVSAEDNGSVSLSPESTDGYLVGNTVTLTATADSGYVFSGWVGTDQCDQEPVCTIIVTEESLSVSATFEVPPLYKLTMTATNGSVVVSPESDTGYLAGTSISLSAQPDFGYRSLIWEGIDDCVTGDTCSFKMPASDVDITARFEDKVPVAWVKQLGTTGTDSVANIAQAPDKSLYVAGDTDGAMEGQTHQGGMDGYLAKFSDSGERIWSRQIGTSANDEVKGVAVDDEGSAYVFGNTSGVFSGQESLGLDDYFLAKYNAEGTLLWLRQFGSEGEDNAVAIAMQDAIVYLSGYSGEAYPDGIPDETYLIKYDLEGNQVLSYSMVNRISEIRQMVLDGQGHIYFAGTDSLGNRYSLAIRQVNESGEDSRGYGVSAGPTFVSGLYGYPYWLVVDASGAASAFLPSARTGDYLLQFSDGFLNDLQSLESMSITGLLEKNGSSVAAALDSKGYYHIIGDVTNLPDSVDENTSTYILTLDADGNKVDYYSLGSSGNDRASAIIVANDDKSIYVAGITEGTVTGEMSAGGTDVFITKILLE